MLTWLASKTIYAADANGDPLTQDIPDLPTGEYGAAFVKMFLTLIALILLLFGTFWILRKLVHRRLQKGSGTQSIQILEKRMISPKTMLYLVDVDGQKVLLAESQLEVRQLQTWRDKEST